MREVPRIVDNGNIGPINSRLVPRYSAETTFALLPRLADLTAQQRTAELKIVGAPFDTGVSYRPGARFGPSHVRQASRLLRPFNPATGTSPFSQVQVADAGDMALNPFDIAEAITTIERAALELAEDGASLLTIGGDHTIALPLLRAASTRAGQPVALLHFDAHLDTWDTYFGADYTHGTPFRGAAEEGLLDSEALCHIGTRGPLYSAQDLRDDAGFGFGIITSTQVLELGVSEVVALLRQRIGERPLYISLDVDVLDPAHAPGTGTPEAGGMTSRELLTILRGLRGLNLIGADVVEVLPAYDHAELTGIAAAHACYDLLTLMADLRANKP